jgi:adenosine deaminase
MQEVIMTIQPYAPISVDPIVAALPKADLHLHQEERARLERVVARQTGHAPHNWQPWATHVWQDTPPGLNRLSAVYAPDAQLPTDKLPGTSPDEIIAKIADVLAQGAADGAVLVEIRFGLAGLAIMRPDFMTLFREAERQVQTQYPHLRAEAIAFMYLDNKPEQLATLERQLKACLRLAGEGLGGLDFSTNPYDAEADPALWTLACEMAGQAVDAGLGITVHAGEFSTANLTAAMCVPGIKRLGHAVYAAARPELLDQLAHSGITVECSLTCNVILGAVPSYEAHPIHQFVAHGIPITLNTDLPVHVATTIGREYALASALDFSTADLLSFTRNAVKASFTSAERRRALLSELQQWEAGLNSSTS